MGFFSWNCLGCDHSIRGPHNIDKTSAWMNDAVVVFPNGDRHSGQYDGYGRIAGAGGEIELELGLVFAMYHRPCWEILGKPEYVRGKSSTSADDQGHFTGEYDPSKPKNKKDLQRLKFAVVRRM